MVSMAQWGVGSVTAASRAWIALTTFLNEAVGGSVVSDDAITANAAILVEENLIVNKF